MPVSDLQLTMAWMRSSNETGMAVDPLWVPGADHRERRALNRIGALARHLCSTSTVNFPLLPEATRRWLAAAPAPPAQVLEELTTAAINAPDATLATLYASAVHSHNRRVLGTFFTPLPEVYHLINRWSATQDQPNHVVDIGAGVGAFTMAAAQHWSRSEVHAIDVNPVTLGLLAARLSLTGDPHLCERTRIVLDDYLTWLDTDWQRLEGSRLVIGNPPYTRSTLIPFEDRSRVLASAGSLVGARASLSTIMTAATLKRMRSSDGLCLILPAQWLDSQYAIELRRHIWSLSDRRVELHLFRSNLFEEAQVDAVMLLVGAAGINPGFFVGTGREPELRRIDRVSTSSPERWRSMVDGPVQTSTEDTVSLDTFATVRRGTATGANHFFTLSSSTAGTLPEKVKRPLLRKISTLKGDVLDAATFDELPATQNKWILAATTDDRYRFPALADYLAFGETLGVHERFLCKARGKDRWFDLSRDLAVPDIIIGAMSKSRFRLIENNVGAAITNNLYGWRWLPSTTMETRAAILGWLRSDAGQDRLRQAAQQQGDHLHKIEPGALMRLAIPKAALKPHGNRG